MNTRTNIVIDDALIAQAMERAGVNTKKAAVEAALRAYVREPDYDLLLAAEGSRLVADDYDPKAAAPPVSGSVDSPAPSKSARARAVPKRKPFSRPAGKKR
ncbi:MAG TPA: type II toxin-antitoxin system VapB family antitoxin [Ramlibacter sp.]|uniref:type II toxin-antitoxin system VapB family antitoxin n=1 Tax=Ramlibacter sp. TaxID=1917967 RepID=UPI002D7FE864|nr:type II toxin-antitoxin system VapB family antitoxin [Ramlibacter sp.]HET8748358.1 type II toxin-antitoxin system VapB family antitoxin [Ramlibacter sp.]